MDSYRSLINIYKNGPNFSQVRSIFTTSHLEMSFADKIRRAMAKDHINTQANPHSFTLLKSKSKAKKEAAKECNCTLGEVENVLGRFRWIKEARKKMDKLKVKGKPMPQNMIEIQKLMGSTATDFARSN
ncbi:hypothetical protein MKX03_021528 [Papaver bracteatum]|nr:hypothetical protein MKX03_021528 [Papaver bracteatum]